MFLIIKRLFIYNRTLEGEGQKFSYKGVINRHGWKNLMFSMVGGKYTYMI